MAETENPYFDAVDRDAAEQFLFSRIDYERAHVMPYDKADFKLDRMSRLLSHLGDPHRELKIVHVAGTKGKGSTSAMIASMLTAAGYRTGLYTSPHLLRVEERLRIDGQLCPAADFVDLVERIKPIVARMDADAADDPATHGPTYFEILTALAFLYFADQRVDCAVMEVGLGGRLDSTNVCLPLVSVITSISFDHTKQLGNTLAAIAGEKAGIIKPGVPVVSGVVADEPREVIRRVAADHGCKLIERTIDFDARILPSGAGGKASPGVTFDFSYRVPPHEHGFTGLTLPLAGHHQAENAAVALAAVAELRRQHWDIDEQAVRQGLGNVECAARVQVVARQPLVVVDVAHNVASIEALLAALENFPQANRRHLIFATTKDKDVPGMLARLLPRFDEVTLTRYQLNPRGITVAELTELAHQLPGPIPLLHTADDLPTAWSRVLANACPGDLIVVTGSFFIAAEMLSLIQPAPAAHGT